MKVKGLFARDGLESFVDWGLVERKKTLGRMQTPYDHCLVGNLYDWTKENIKAFNPECSFLDTYTFQGIKSH